MRKLIIFGLVAAIGAVAMIQHASAGQNADFCRDHPNWPGCEGTVVQPPQGRPPGPPPGQPGNPPGQWPHQQGYNDGWRHHHGDWGGGPNVGIYFGFDGGEPPPPPGYGYRYYSRLCRNVAFDLRDQGFERVRPVRCSSPRLVFSAWRDGEKVFLYVTPNGRIMRIVPAY